MICMPFASLHENDLHLISKHDLFLETVIKIYTPTWNVNLFMPDFASDIV